MSTQTVRVTDLSLSDVEDLTTFLQRELQAAGIEHQVQLEHVTERRTSRGVAFPIPPELLVTFGTAVVQGVGVGVGKFLFDKLREWAARKNNNDAKLVDDGKETRLTDLDKPDKDQ